MQPLVLPSLCVSWSVWPVFWTPKSARSGSKSAYISARKKYFVRKNLSNSARHQKWGEIVFYCISLIIFSKKSFKIFLSFNALKIAMTSVNLTPSKKNMKNKFSWNREKRGEKNVTNIDDGTKIKKKIPKLSFFSPIYLLFFEKKDFKKREKKCNSRIAWV